MTEPSPSALRQATRQPTSAGERARQLHRLGVEATAGGRPGDGARDLRAGLRLLGWRTPSTGDVGPPDSGDTDVDTSRLAARLLISLAHAEAERGKGKLGFRLLDLATAWVSPADEGVLLQQRGLLLLRAGHLDEALGCLDRAEPALTAHGHTIVLARTLLNRAALNLYTGRVRSSRRDANRCAELAASLDLPLLAGKAVHNAGYCDLLNGDIPAALAAFATAERHYVQHGSGFLPVLAAAKARALLGAGLVTEAGRMLDAALADFARQRLGHDVAEAELWRAQAALESGDLTAARRWATAAGRHFRLRENNAWTAAAALMRLRADFPAVRATARFVNRADRVGADLRNAGLVRDAELADLLAVRALVAAGRLDAAVDRMTTVRARPRAALDTVLTRRITRSELALRQGRRGAAFSELRAGLVTLHTYRSTLGSPDLQVGAAALGRELASAGLDLALADDSPALVFAWSERVRAQALRIPPVRPPNDPRLSEVLAELRQLRNLLRTAELEGRREPHLVTRCTELERSIREVRWQVPGPGATKPVSTLREVQDELARTERTLLCYLSWRGQMHAVVVRPAGVHLTPLGDQALADEATQRLLADLDALAGRTVPARLETVIRGSIARQLDVLSGQLLAGLRHQLAETDLVIVPTRALASLPWGLLPELRGRAVTVAASATSWHTAARTERTSRPVRVDRAPRRGGHLSSCGSEAAPGRAVPEPRTGSSERATLLVAGPDVTDAVAEIEEIAKIYPGSKKLTGTDATVAATLRHLDGAPAAHLAAHGHHEPESALFSRLDLVDGPLMAYDIHDLYEPPRHVTLSACDVGRTTVSTGDEVLGFTAALLYGGTSNVVAGVARVTHEAAVSVMCAYHRAVELGAPPSRALAEASALVPLAPFVCFGAG